MNIRPQLIALRALVPRRTPRRALILPSHRIHAHDWITIRLDTWNKHFGASTP